MVRSLEDGFGSILCFDTMVWAPPDGPPWCFARTVLHRTSHHGRMSHVERRHRSAATSRRGHFLTCPDGRDVYIIYDTELIGKHLKKTHRVISRRGGGAIAAGRCSMLPAWLEGIGLVKEHADCPDRNVFVTAQGAMLGVWRMLDAMAHVAHARLAICLFLFVFHLLSITHWPSNLDSLII